MCITNISHEPFLAEYAWTSHASPVTTRPCPSPPEKRGACHIFGFLWLPQLVQVQAPWGNLVTHPPHTRSEGAKELTGMRAWKKTCSWEKGLRPFTSRGGNWGERSCVLLAQWEATGEHSHLPWMRVSLLKRETEILHEDITFATVMGAFIFKQQGFSFFSLSKRKLHALKEELRIGNCLVWSMQSDRKSLFLHALSCTDFPSLTLPKTTLPHSQYRIAPSIKGKVISIHSSLPAPSLKLINYSHSAVKTEFNKRVSALSV